MQFGDHYTPYLLLEHLKKINFGQYQHQPKRILGNYLKVIARTDVIGHATNDHDIYRLTFNE